MYFKLKKMKIRNLQDNIKQKNICVMGVPEGEEREKVE